MPYASLHEAFSTYTEYLDSSNQTSNPDLLNNPPDNNNNNDYDYLPRAIPEPPVQRDAVAAFDALQLASEIRVPKNQSALQTPDIRSIRQRVPTESPGSAARARQIAGADEPAPPQKSFRCDSDHDCMEMINHILECDKCAEKLRKILNLGGGGNFGGIDLDSKNLSRILFYFIIALLVIAVYELLNSLFKKAFKSG